VANLCFMGFSPLLRLIHDEFAWLMTNNPVWSGC